jgi:host factor-I protein
MGTGEGEPADGTSAIVMSFGNIQESFFHAARQGNKHVTVHLINGVRLSGRVRSFDKHSVVLETTTLEQLVFKHSISAASICVNEHCAECYPDQTSPALHA